MFRAVQLAEPDALCHQTAGMKAQQGNEAGPLAHKSACDDGMLPPPPPRPQAMPQNPPRLQSTAQQTSDQNLVYLTMHSLLLSRSQGLHSCSSHLQSSQTLAQDKVLPTPEAQTQLPPQLQGKCKPSVIRLHPKLHSLWALPCHHFPLLFPLLAVICQPKQPWLLHQHLQNQPCFSFQRGCLDHMRI